MILKSKVNPVTFQVKFNYSFVPDTSPSIRKVKLLDTWTRRAASLTYPGPTNLRTHESVVGPQDK